eukprot:TRINITY_DN7490_c1_g1_i5.p1 TRINITY_DN7490_c1_g1~~TRINITY_DN7490_c1_g1_i5.p1  ORF type:complete len:1272 (+),score=229.98 TRINITY_DN7490_c1_g1_i5:735-4550(+)
MEEGSEGAALAHVPRFTPEQLKEATNNLDALNILAAGSSGEVFVGDLNGEKVAIKRAKARRNASNGTLLDDEVRVLGKVNHPNLLRLLGYCPELDCCVTEFCEGGSLEQALKERRPLSWGVRLQICYDMTAALMYLHREKNVLHRDLKPANVLLDKNNCCKLADFGLSRQFLEDVTSVETRTRGTQGYFAPEYAGSGILSYASDTYALGLVILQLLTGEQKIHRIHGVLARCPGTGMQRRVRAVGLFSQQLDDNAGRWDRTITEKVLSAAVWCTESNKKLRPDLKEGLLPRLRQACLDAQTTLELGEASKDSSPPDTTGHAPFTTLGISYELGDGVPRNLVSATKLYELARQQGNPEAMYRLAWCHALGRGVDQDDAKAFTLFQEAAKLGFGKAQFEVGMCYKRGWGVRKSTELSEAQFKLAAAKGFPTHVTPTLARLRPIYPHSRSGSESVSFAERLAEDVGGFDDDDDDDDEDESETEEEKAVEKVVEKVVKEDEEKEEKDVEEEQERGNWRREVRGEAQEEQMEKEGSLLLESDGGVEEFRGKRGRVDSFSPVQRHSSPLHFWRSQSCANEPTIVVPEDSDGEAATPVRETRPRSSVPVSPSPSSPLFSIPPSPPPLEDADQEACHNAVCHACLAYPITGLRYQSKVTWDYDLCAACFERQRPDRRVDYSRVEYGEMDNGWKATISAISHLKGWGGVLQHVRRGLFLLRGEESSGNSNAQYILGTLHVEGSIDRTIIHDKTKAVDLVSLAAEQGHRRALCLLGVWAYHGKMVPKNDKKALRFLQMGLREDSLRGESLHGVEYAKAQCTLGLMLLNGERVEMNYEEAVSWFGRAANQAHALAQFHMGECYRKGLGVVRDLADAHEWYAKKMARGPWQGEEEGENRELTTIGVPSRALGFVRIRRGAEHLPGLLRSQSEGDYRPSSVAHYHSSAVMLSGLGKDVSDVAKKSEWEGASSEPKRSGGPDVPTAAREIEAISHDGELSSSGKAAVTINVKPVDLDRMRIQELKAMFQVKTPPPLKSSDGGETKGNGGEEAAFSVFPSPPQGATWKEPWPHRVAFVREAQPFGPGKASSNAAPVVHSRSEGSSSYLDLKNGQKLGRRDTTGGIGVWGESENVVERRDKWENGAGMEKDHAGVPPDVSPTALPHKQNWRRNFDTTFPISQSDAGPGSKGSWGKKKKFGRLLEGLFGRSRSALAAPAVAAVEGFPKPGGSTVHLLSPLADGVSILPRVSRSTGLEAEVEPMRSDPRVELPAMTNSYEGPYEGCNWL